MWSHILASLGKLTSIKNKFKWTKFENTPFVKLSGSFPAIIYQIIQILIRNLEFTPMSAHSS